MITHILEPDKVKLTKYLSKAHKRILKKDDAYVKFESRLGDIKKIKTKEKNLSKTLTELKRSMIEVIEAEKNLHFRQQSKTAVEIAMESQILKLENKLNNYLEYRDKRIKHLEKLQQKFEKRDLLPEPEPVSKDKIPIITEPTKEEKIKEIKNKINEMKKLVAKLKKDQKVPKTKLDLLEKKIKEYEKRMKNL